MNEWITLFTEVNTLQLRTGKLVALPKNIKTNLQKKGKSSSKKLKTGKKEKNIKCNIKRGSDDRFEIK